MTIVPTTIVIRPEKTAHPELWDGLIGFWDFRDGVCRQYQRPPQPTLLECLIALAILVCLFTENK